MSLIQRKNNRITKEHKEMKLRGSYDVSYLDNSVDQMIIDFMKEEEIPGFNTCNCSGSLYSKSCWIWII